MTEQAAPREVTAEDLDRLVDSAIAFTKAADGFTKTIEGLQNVAGSSSSTSGVHFHGGGLVAVGLALIGLFAIMWAAGESKVDRIERAAELRVLAEARRADMAELTALRAQVQSAGDDIKGLRAWDASFTRELATIKASTNGK